LVLRRIVFFLALMAGIVASQLPEYAQQYRQRLGGAIDELARIIATFDADAARSSMSRDEGIARLAASPDPFVRQRADAISGDIARVAKLEKQLQAYEAAGPFWRIVSFATDHEPDIARRAAQNFEPAVPVTVEGLVLALTGFGAGWVGGRLLIAPIQRRRRIAYKR
jgi:hypothetical protein